ncbi:Meiotic nuclear division protein 1 [Quaeritorhiza haematococci]|nr:Meiotic nuclear division protein 1 [Quaeritorhiza haematococci]
MSGRKKPLSVEEKRKRMVDLLFETRDFWQLKELEKMGAKQKGIVAQTVKEVLDGLVADNLVSLEKIGTSNYYWSFPSTGLITRQAKLEELESEAAKLKAKKAELEAGIAKAQAGREESDERNQLLQELAKSEQLKKVNVAELQKYRDCDPMVLEMKAKAASDAKDAANRWTENIFNVQSYCSKNFNMTWDNFCTNFQIPDDLDTVS